MVGRFRHFILLLSCAAALSACTQSGNVFQSASSFIAATGGEEPASTTLSLKKRTLYAAFALSNWSYTLEFENEEDLESVRLVGSSISGLILTNNTLSIEGNGNFPAVGEQSIEVEVRSKSGTEVTEQLKLLANTRKTCVWSNAAQNQEYQDVENWDFCHGAAPSALSEIALPSGITGPVLEDSVSIAGVAEVEPQDQGGRIILLKRSGGTSPVMDIRSPAQIRSSIEFYAIDQNGGGNYCYDCRIVTNQDVEIVNGATLSLLDRVTFQFQSSGLKLRVGDGASAGHLKLKHLDSFGMSRIREFPRITALSGLDFNSITVEGAASDNTLSSVEIDGAYIEQFSSIDAPAFDFKSDYHVASIERILLNNQASGTLSTTGFLFQGDGDDQCKGTFGKEFFSNVFFNTASDEAQFTPLQMCNPVSVNKIEMRRYNCAKNLGPVSCESTSVDPHSIFIWAGDAAFPPLPSI